MLKVMTIVGTRPEIIRLSRVIAALDRYCDHVLVHTGQNYDFELNQVFFDELGIRAADGADLRGHLRNATTGQREDLVVTGLLLDQDFAARTQRLRRRLLGS